MSSIEDVRAIVVDIPAGQVISYGQIGTMIGMGPRQVGHAMTLLNDDVPWWRVVYADGTPSSCHHGAALELLRAEQTPMVGKRVDVQLARYTPNFSNLTTQPVSQTHLDGLARQSLRRAKVARTASTDRPARVTKSAKR